MARYILTIVTAALTVVFAVVALLIGIRASSLSLPIPIFLSILAVLLPLINHLAIYTSVKNPFARGSKTPPSKFAVLFVEALTTISAQLDTILIALSASHLPAGPLDCALDSRWRALFTAKNGKAIRTIQDSLKCCGFKSVRDKAWPLPGGGNGPDACQRMYGKERDVGCLNGWQRQEQLVLGVFIAVGVCSLGSKLILYLILHYRPSWLGRGQAEYAWHSRAQPRRLLEHNTARQGQLESGSYTDDPVAEEPGVPEPVADAEHAER